MNSTVQTIFTVCWRYISMVRRIGYNTPLKIWSLVVLLCGNSSSIKVGEIVFPRTFCVPEISESVAVRLPSPWRPPGRRWSRIRSGREFLATPGNQRHLRTDHID